MTFGFDERLRYLRNQKGITQAELAKLLDISRSAVNSWEFGINYPSIEMLIKLTEIFNVSADFLLSIEKKTVIDISVLSDQEKAAVWAVVDCLKDKEWEFRVKVHK